VVRSLVEQHGGSVSAASKGLGNGSEFTVRLPAPRHAMSATHGRLTAQGAAYGEFQQEQA
jgi:K+-sensing histidine kinase KdpD